MPDSDNSLVEDSIKLLRHQLGSIDLSDFEDEKPMTPDERKEYVAAISAVWPRLEKDIKRLQYHQVMFIAITGTDWEQVIFGRGTFNGLDLLKDKWEKAAIEHNAKEQPEGFDKHDPIGKV